MIAHNTSPKRRQHVSSVEVSLKDMYQMLIAECRYGYTRNNHLMPFGAYEHVKEYLPRMLAIDEDFALSTAKQLCEECISDELLIRFARHADDEFHNLRMACGFIRWLVDWINTNNTSHQKSYIPYNYDIFCQDFS